MSAEFTSNIKLFYCYAREDETLRDELEKHLGNLKRQGQITDWHDRNISPGKDWSFEIDIHLHIANIILLLVSPSFMASDYCYGIEMKKALARHEIGEARVIPVILRPVDWKGASFSKLQVLPADGRPVTSWLNRDEAFLEVTQGIQKVIEELTSEYEELRIQVQQVLSGNRPREALKLLESLRLAQIPSPLRWRLAALRGQCYFSLRQFLTAQRDFHFAVAEKPEAVPSDQALEVMLLHLYLAATNRELGQLEDASGHYQAAIGMMNAGTSLRYIAEAHWGMALVTFELARRASDESGSLHITGPQAESALRHAESAKTLYHAIDDDLSAASLSCEIGLIEQAAGKLDKARLSLRQVLETWGPRLDELVENNTAGRRRKQQRANVVSASACYLAGVELEAHNYEAAFTYVHQAEKAAKQSYILRRAEAAIMLGKILEAQSFEHPGQDGSAAEEAFRKAVTELEATDRVAAKIHAHDLLGRLLLKKGKWDEGERELNLARRLSHFVPTFSSDSFVPTFSTALTESDPES